MSRNSSESQYANNLLLFRQDSAGAIVCFRFKKSSARQSLELAQEEFANSWNDMENLASIGRMINRITKENDGKEPAEYSGYGTSASFSSLPHSWQERINVHFRNLNETQRRAGIAYKVNAIRSARGLFDTEYHLQFDERHWVAKPMQGSENEVQLYAEQETPQPVIRTSGQNNSA